MRVRTTDRPTIRLAGNAARVPLIQEGVNPLIAAHVAAIPNGGAPPAQGPEQHVPGGSAPDHHRARPDGSKGSELTYLHGVAITGGTPVPDDRAGWLCPPGAGRFHLPRPPPPKRCMRPGPRLRPGGSPQTRGACDPDHRSWQFWSTTRTSRPPHCELWQPVERARSGSPRGRRITSGPELLGAQINIHIRAAEPQFPVTRARATSPATVAVEGVSPEILDRVQQLPLVAGSATEATWTVWFSGTATAHARNSSASEPRAEAG